MSSKVVSVAAKLKKIREAYVKQLPTQLEVINTAFNACAGNPAGHEEMEVLHRALHTLKGASASFGLKKLSAAAAEGEQLINETRRAEIEDEERPDKAWIALMKQVVTHIKSEAAGIEATQEADLQALDLVAVSGNSQEREQKVVYLCEDDSFQRMSLAAQIGCFGFQVIAFGELEQLYKAVKNSTPDVIVMDLMFSDKPTGGAEMISRIQAERDTAIPTVFISSQDDFSYRLAAVRAGSSAYFVKPVNAIELCTSLTSLTTTVKPEPYRIMIVDDDPHLTQLYSAVLQGANMVTLEVNNPLLAMSHFSEFKPDLILTDMNMPGCNGMELAKTIRQAEGSFSIPIVFLSSETNTDKQFNAMRMGGDEFLTKPIKPEHLISAVAVRAERMKIIRSMMIRDAMTGQFNHSAIKERLEVEIALAVQNGNEICFALVGVDNIKQLNNSYGQPTGDRVLITLATFLRQRLRKIDLVGRYDGNEFAVILPECDIHMAVQLLDQLRESFAGIEFPVGGDSFSPTFSCGIAPLSRFGDIEQICKAADTALHQAKEGGRNRVMAAS